MTVIMNVALEEWNAMSYKLDTPFETGKIRSHVDLSISVDTLVGLLQ